MKIQRASLGRQARLGDLYDASTDNIYSGLSIFTEQIPLSLVTCEPRIQMKCEIGVTDSRIGRCNSLGLTPEEQLSVLGLEIPVSGCAEYVAPEASNGDETTVSLIYRNSLLAQRLNVYANEGKPYISLESAKRCGATHFVYEVEWGSNTVMALSFRAGAEEENRQDLARHLALQMLNAVAADGFGRCATHHSNNLTDLPNGMRLEFYTDSDISQEKPRTLEECGMLLRNISRSLKENTGEVKQVMYTLLPISVLEPFTNQIANAPQRLTDHDDSTTTAILNLLQSLDKKEVGIREIVRNIQEKPQFFTKLNIRNITIGYEGILTSIKSLKKQVAENIKMYRLGRRNVEDIRMTLQSSQTVFNEIEQFFNKFSTVTEKLTYLKKCEELGAYIVMDLVKFQQMLPNGECFVFFTRLSQMDERFTQNSKTFEKLCRMNRAKCMLFDNDVHQLDRFKDHRIVQYFAACSFEEDVCRLDTLLQDYNVVKINNLLREDVKKPNPRARLQVVCPNSLLKSGCDGKKREWVCYHCGALVDYAFNNHLYCECGESDPLSVEWCCADPAHGLQYVEFDKRALAKELDEVQRTKEFNILLIGETGAGKSTWINSIANYVIHDNLTTAAQYPLTCLIPSSFSIQTATDELKEISVGSSDNEIFKKGQSATQKPQTYTFMYNNALIRLIDVPGVCDTRGPQQDKENFNLILRELQTITELHAICILLGPDATRLTLAFLYCINELLTHLHKTAARNIVFCFTKTRQTFYRAGQTLPILRDYLAEFENLRHVKIPLEKNTMYYFDNEAFRLLCAIQNGVEFSEREKQAYEESWSISAKETNRFLNYVLGLEPHLTREMLSLNEARRIIVSLTQPLAKIQENIKTNIRLIDAAKQEVELLKNDVSGYEKKLHIKQMTLRAKSLQYPQTVCSAPCCTESMSLAETGEQVRYYKTICHAECYLEGIEPDKFPDPKLKNCNAMGGGKSEKCLRCGCRWELHLHRNVEHMQEETTVVDKTTDALLKDAQNRRIKKEEVLADFDRRKKVLEEKHTRITEICATFGAFLDRNSIVPYNDAMVSYLDYAIQLAEQEAAISKDRTKVDSLQSFLKRYTEELGILKSNLAVQPDEITLEDVIRLKQELYSLNTSDCNVAEYLKEIEEANDKHYCRKDQYIDVEQLASKGKRKKKLPTLARAKHAVQSFYNRAWQFVSGSTPNNDDRLLANLLEPYQSRPQTTDPKTDKRSGIFGFGRLGM